MEHASQCYPPCCTRADLIPLQRDLADRYYPPLDGIIYCIILRRLSNHDCRDSDEAGV